MFLDIGFRVQGLFRVQGWKVADEVCLMGV